ncbi:hypothetical protein [Bacillus sp. 1NLA3E]|uniref:hypothetical protein n=1 Tax=Bacillus sp. 1NLA3E TaxID=666686 RepID=UPI000247E64C|nr:hypothetical protein [Bacillus sp. 1NLA3E]
MAQLNVQNLPINGLVKTMSSASAGGDTFTNDGNTILYVKNGGASPVTVTVNSVAPCSQGFDHDLVVSLAAGSEISFPKLDPYRFNDLSTGLVSVSYSTVTSVTVAAVRLN